MSNAGGSSNNNNNNASPFDFDVDFDKVQRRRDQYLAKKAAERGEPLLHGMDADSSQDPTAADAGADASNHAATAKPGFARGFNWLRGTGQGGDGTAAHHHHLHGHGHGHGHSQTGEDAPPILYGGKQVVQWPYDDYHVVQQHFYVKLEELEQRGETKESDTGTARAAAASNNNNANTSSNLQRPTDPPDIPTAVRNLPLHDFESKAEERAIAIVGTWLFDCGLIDELLVHGGMTHSTLQSSSDRDDTNHSTAASTSGASANDNASMPSQEGVEIGPSSGFPIEGPSKMDKEMAKLKATSQRTLALINARLNDGVAASGAEVQELVNAVNSTKDDLGRLRELSTYISGGAAGNVNAIGIPRGLQASAANNPAALGAEERSQKFMLTRYPKLKKAINARRNLARCFRELDFYSQIPVTCDRLREELHANEWTENEWSCLRQVGREHVELEIFLVEAEAGMKKRIDEEAQELRSPAEPRQRSILPTSGNNTTTSSAIAAAKHRASYIPSGKMPHNYEEVDNFLHEHVKNVWELGDEIRLRIMSGIGSAFELAMNNPAGMVALVEAVEVYETANEEYKTVHGEEAGSSTSLRFTDMRASALKQIYQDFEMRALEVFREVQESVRINQTGVFVLCYCIQVHVISLPRFFVFRFLFRLILTERTTRMQPMLTFPPYCVLAIT